MQRFLRLKIDIATLTLLAPGALLAQKVGVPITSVEYKANNKAQLMDCANAMTQSDINQCAAADYKKADRQLNKTYKEVFGNAEAAQQTALKAAQNA